VARAPSVAGVTGRDSHDVSPVRVSAIAQIRREFGSPPVRTASATRTGSGGSLSSTTGPSMSPAAAKAQTSQTQSEFGFEK